VRIGQPEGLVVHEELNDLAVGHIADRLASFCEPISLFSVDDWPRFIKPINESAIFGIGAAFLWAPAHAEITIAKRKHGFQLGQKFGAKGFLYDIPVIGRIIMG